LIVDFHAHAYSPEFIERIAARVARGGWEHHLPPAAVAAGFRGPTMVIEGSPRSLVEAMSSAGIDRATVMPVAYRPEWARDLNDWTLDACDGHPELIPFASIHPDDPGWRVELARVLARGARGVKIHPELQLHRGSACLLEDSYLEVFEAVSQAGVPVVTCTFFREEVLAGSEGVGPRLKSVVSMFPRLRLVAAHMGAMLNWAANHAIIGSSAYLDLAFVPNQIEDRELVRMIRAHGADRVLFGSDAPYAHPKDMLEGVLRLGLHDDELDALLWRNAADLIDLEAPSAPTCSTLEGT
jgi:hypothetical protein